MNGSLPVLSRAQSEPTEISSILEVSTEPVLRGSGRVVEVNDQSEVDIRRSLGYRMVEWQ